MPRVLAFGSIGKPNTQVSSSFTPTPTSQPRGAGKVLPFGSIKSPAITPQTQYPETVNTAFEAPKPLEKPKGFLRKAFELSMSTNPILGDFYSKLTGDNSKKELEKFVLDQTVNRPKIKEALKDYSREVSGTSIGARIKSIGPSTYEEEYKKATDKKNQELQNAGFGKKLEKSIVDSAPSTLIGLALGFIPIVGKPLQAAHFAAQSAGGQIEDKGEVTSVGNIAIDVVGDRLLGGVTENILKKPVKDLIKTGFKQYAKDVGISALTEGVTEPSQTLLKFANDYKNAGTPDEKKAVVSQTKDYIKNGGLFLELVSSGIIGGGIGAGAGAISQAQTQPEYFDEKEEGPRKELQDKIKGMIQKDIESGKEQFDVASELVDQFNIPIQNAEEMVAQAIEDTDIGKPKIDQQTIQSVLKETRNEVSETQDEIVNRAMEDTRKEVPATQEEEIRRVLEETRNEVIPKTEEPAPIIEEKAPVVEKPVQTVEEQPVVEKQPVIEDETTGRSKAFERVREQLQQENPELYQKIKISDEIAGAQKLVESKPERAKNIAMGLVPEGMSEAEQAAVSIAYAEKKLAEGTPEARQEAADAIRSRSLRATKYGQAIVMERGRTGDVTAAELIRDVVQARLAQNLKKYEKAFSKESKTDASKKLKEKIDEDKKKLKKKVEESSDLSDPELQKLFEELAC